MKQLENEISQLKNNSKAIKYQMLENEYRLRMEELYNVKENYNNLINSNSK